MRTTLRYGAAVGLMAAAFGAFGPVSAYAGQNPGTATAPIAAVQQTHSLPGHMVGQDRRRFCRSWGSMRRYGRYYRFCRSWFYR